MEVHDFHEHVLPAELDDVRNRVVAHGRTRGDGLPQFAAPEDETLEHSAVFKAVIEELTQADNDRAWNDGRSVAHTGLVGLAFSGGGIRSATFNLGVLQTLDKLGLFKQVDYLSTVSGGAYLGSCVSALLTSIKDEPRENMPAQHQFPFRHIRGECEPNVFRYLRNHANYLAPKGLVDVVRIPAMLLRGIVVNMLVVLPYVLAAAIVTMLANSTPDKLVGSDFLVTKVLLGLLVVLFAVYPLIHLSAQKLSGESTWALRNGFSIS